MREIITKLKANRKLLIGAAFLLVFAAGLAIGTIISNIMNGQVSMVYGIGDVTITNIAGPDVIVINQTFTINVTFQNTNDFDVGVQVVFNFTFVGLLNVDETYLVFEGHNGTLTPDTTPTEHAISIGGNIITLFTPAFISKHAIILPAGSTVTIVFKFHITHDADSIDYSVWAVAPPQ